MSQLLQFLQFHSVTNLKKFFNKFFNKFFLVNHAPGLPAGQQRQQPDDGRCRHRRVEQQHQGQEEEAGHHEEEAPAPVVRGRGKNYQSNRLLDD